MYNRLDHRCQISKWLEIYISDSATTDSDGVLLLHMFYIIEKSIVIVQKINFEFSDDTSVWVTLNSKKLFLENFCMYVP